MTSTSFRPSPSSRSSSTFLRSDPANPRRIREEDLDTRERSFRHWESVQPVPALGAAVHAVPSAEESDPDILKAALDVSADDLDPEVTTSPERPATSSSQPLPRNVKEKTT